MKLMVQDGRKPPFHPTIKLRDTGFSRGHWQGVFFRPGAFGGIKTIREVPTVAGIVAHYLSELRRTGHVVVQANGRKESA